MKSSSNEIGLENQNKPENISIEPLKKFVIENLPLTSELRDSILSEVDNVPKTEFMGLIRAWLKLLNFEAKHDNLLKDKST
jgi:hypothetical protein